MILIVDKKYSYNDFISFLKRRMLQYFASNVNLKKIKLYNEYFNSEEFKEKYGDVSIDSFTVIKIGITNLKSIKYPTYTELTIDDKLTYPGTDIKIKDLCKIINYGNLSIDAYPIFTDMFRYFTIRMKTYVNKYELGVG